MGGVRKRLIRRKRGAFPAHATRPLTPTCEVLEQRIFLSANLPGLHLVDPIVDRFDGQVIYLDFDGEEDVDGLSASGNDDKIDALLADIVGDDAADSAQPTSVLLISSMIEDADVLAEAADDDVIVIRYDAETATLDSLLQQVRDELGDTQADSIAIAAHDLTGAKFHLAGSEIISLDSTLASESQQAFWSDLGSLLAEDGRIDLLACNLAATEQGQLLVSTLEGIAGVNFAASTDL
ncbi:MAG TPA: DUF4347 domain-containing protein, partial [Phycisphaerae bacterium]|nr:DUF4347 domain-containing protein [Phycisphaerae bacterium]